MIKKTFIYKNVKKACVDSQQVLMTVTQMVENNRSKKETVGTDLVQISEEIQPSNGERVLIRFMNTSTTQYITIGVDSQAESGLGIVLAPGGLHMESKDSDKFNIVSQKRFTAISDVAGGTLAVYERVIQ